MKLSKAEKEIVIKKLERAEKLLAELKKRLTKNKTTSSIAREIYDICQQLFVAREIIDHHGKEDEDD